MPTLADLNNTEAAIEAGREHLHESEPTMPGDFETLHGTRESLETPQGDVDGSPDADADDSEKRIGYAMTDDRRVGTTILESEADGRMRFGKPTGRSSMEIDRALKGADDAFADDLEFYEWVWQTLEEWSLDEEFDVDHWADEYAMVGALNLIRALTMGGNAGRG